MYYGDWWMLLATMSFDVENSGKFQKTRGDKIEFGLKLQHYPADYKLPTLVQEKEFQMECLNLGKTT